MTNWTGVLMLFYPVHFKGWRAPWLMPLARLLPHIAEVEALSRPELEAMADEEE